MTVIGPLSNRNKKVCLTDMGVKMENRDVKILNFGGQGNSCAITEVSLPIHLQTR